MELSKLDGDLEILIDYSDQPTITLRGEVDYRNTHRVKQAIGSLIERGKSINVDLKELVFMDSTGVSALVDAAKAAFPNGGELTLVSPSQQLAKVLKRSGLSKIFRYRGKTAARAPIECVDAVRTADVLEFEVPARAEMISHIRFRVAQFACTMPFGPEDIEDIKLAVGEAGANALRHGASPGCYIGVRAEKHDDCIIVQIRDSGCGFDPEAVPTPALGDLSPGGRGIMFMRALMDEVRFSFSKPGTCVELVKRLPGRRDN
mgnify:FL=1